MWRSAKPFPYDFRLSVRLSQSLSRISFGVFFLGRPFIVLTSEFQCLPFGRCTHARCLGEKKSDMPSTLHAVWKRIKSYFENTIRNKLSVAFYSGSAHFFSFIYVCDIFCLTLPLSHSSSSSSWFICRWTCVIAQLYSAPTCLWWMCTFLLKTRRIRWVSTVNVFFPGADINQIIVWKTTSTREGHQNQLILFSRFIVGNCCLFWRIFMIVFIFAASF